MKTLGRFLFSVIMGTRLSSSAAAGVSILPLSASAPSVGGSPREVAIVAGGCFWCVESIYSGMKGVDSAVSGYIGGATADPTYDDICTGATGHAEAVAVTYDPSIVNYKKLLKVFFTVHDSTTLNRQGNDRGTQYRSAIFYLSPAQKEIAQDVIAEVQTTLSAPIVTEVTAASTFYRAEEYHQNYFAKKPGDGYCNLMVPPKLAKARTKFPELL
jgi:peptide-methionine (S)-S-oxide reductase